MTDDGLNDAVAPTGRPEADNTTSCADPFVVVVLTVLVPEPPGARGSEVGERLREKSLAGAVVPTR